MCQEPGSLLSRRRVAAASAPPFQDPLARLSGSGHVARRSAGIRAAGAPAASATARPPRAGCSGAKVPVAPEAPSRAKTILLQAGQLTANQPRTPEPMPARLLAPVA